jgi:CBS domain-containing membrane protein
VVPMRVRDIMQRHVTVVSEDDSLSLAQQLMRWSDFRHLPVVQPVSRVILGLLSERDVLRALASSGNTAETLAKPVREFMSKPVESISQDAELSEAAARMTTHRFGCLPVVERGLVHGMLSVSDVLSALAQCPLPARTREPAVNDPPVTDVMYPEPITVPPHAMLVPTAATMAQRGVRHACVVDGVGRVIGVISDRDVRRLLGHPSRALAPATVPGDLLRLRVDQIMSTPKIVREDAPLSEAVTMLLSGQVGALPVTDAQGRLRGLVSYVDLLRHLREMLADVSTPPSAESPQP